MLNFHPKEVVLKVSFLKENFCTFTVLCFGSTVRKINNLSIVVYLDMRNLCVLIKFMSIFVFLVILAQYLVPAANFIWNREFLMIYCADEIFYSLSDLVAIVIGKTYNIHKSKIEKKKSLIFIHFPEPAFSQYIHISIRVYMYFTIAMFLINHHTDHDNSNIVIWEMLKKFLCFNSNFSIHSSTLASFKLL